MFKNSEGLEIWNRLDFINPDFCFMIVYTSNTQTSKIRWLLEIGKQVYLSFKF